MPIALRAKKGTPKVSLKSRLTRDRSKPFTYRASGSLVLPASITKNATWCSGGVFISLTRGPVTVGATTVKLKPDCTYAKTVSVQGNARLATRNGRTGHPEARRPLRRQHAAQRQVRDVQDRPLRPAVDPTGVQATRDV